MQELKVRCETSQEIWDFLEEFVWPKGGSLMGDVLGMSETGHVFTEYTYQMPTEGDKAHTPTQERVR